MMRSMVFSKEGAGTKTVKYLRRYQITAFAFDFGSPP